MHCPLYNIHRQNLVDSFNELNIEFTNFRRGFVPEFSLVLNILREGLDFVEAGRPFQSRNVQGMKLYELNIEFTIQTILYGSETSDYNQNVKLFRAVHSFNKRSKRPFQSRNVQGMKLLLFETVLQKSSLK
jgi:hypothetical protein